MPRPPNADAAATRRRVLEVAARRFSAHGIGGTSIRDIAVDARVTGATVLHYFGSKDELYDACVESMYEELGSLREELFPLLAAAAAPAKGTQENALDRNLERIVPAVFRFARAHHAAIRLLLRQVVETGEIGGARRERHLLPFLDQASVLLEAATGTPRRELRLTLQSLVFLIGRYAIADADELAAVAGTGKEAALRAVEAHLAGIVRRQLAPALAPPPPRRRRTRRG